MKILFYFARKYLRAFVEAFSDEINFETTSCNKEVQNEGGNFWLRGIKVRDKLTVGLTLKDNEIDS